MSNFKVFLFGPPRLEDDERPLEINRRKGWALLAFLLIDKNNHSRDALASMFWPNYSQTSARANLRREISRLKRLLGEGPLVIDREHAAVRPSAAIWVDVDQFTSLIQAAQAHHHSLGQMCPACLQHLSQAADLYTADLLAGFTLADTPAFDEWQFFQAEALRQQMMYALEQLVREYSARQEYEQAISFARRWLALDPLHEPVYRQLMRLYAWTGQRSAALRLYRICAMKLAEDLDVKPAEETTILSEAIKTRRFTYLPPRQMRPPAGQSAPPILHPAADTRPLPRPLNRFVDRQEELSVIVELLADRQRRLLTIVGLKGLGTTRLLVEAAARAPAPADGVIYLPLAGRRPADYPGLVNPLIPLLAEALSLRFHGGADPLTQLLVTLRDRELLLILDDFDTLLADKRFPETADIVPALLQNGPGLQLLIGSRRRLRVTDEWVLPLRGLTYPEEEIDRDEDAPAAAIARYGAARLFAARAASIRPDFALEENLAAVGRIGQLVKGFPLGLEVAAGLLNRFSCREIAQKIGQGVARAAGETRSGFERYRGLRVVIREAWLSLTPAERQACRRLSIFPGPFGQDAADRVAGVSPAELAALEKLALLNRLPEDHYEMHELLRQEGRARLMVRAQEYARLTHAYTAYVGVGKPGEPAASFFELADLPQ